MLGAVRSPLPRLLLGLAFAAAGCAPSDPPQHLVLLTLDTLRADRLGAYGHDRPTTPNLDRWIARGVRFDDALSQAVSTPPSHASMLTGLTPLSHGLRALTTQRLPAANVTLAELLGEHGFTTAAFVSALPLRRALGLDQGFDVYEDSFAEAGEYERSAAATNERIRAWLPTRGDGRLFLWVHYFEPHWPYEPTEAARRALGIERGEGLPQVNVNPATRSGPAVAPADADRVRYTSLLYDGDVRAMDDAVGELEAMLDEAGILDDAVVAIVADHGECLGEHGYYFAHWDVFEETARIPLALVHPRRRWAGRRVDAPVATTDLMPTLLRWLGIESDRHFDGIDLTPLVEGAPGPDRVVYTEQVQYFVARAVRDRRWLYLRRQRVGPGPGRDRGGELYERATGRRVPDDAPGEPARARARLAAALAALRPSASMRPEPIEVSGDVAERLRRLGYVVEPDEVSR